MRLWTLGYEKAGLDAFIATLKQAGIETLVDVRDLPLSRRAGFSKRPLAAALAEAGIGYVHLKTLGTPKEGRIAARTGEHALFWEIVDRRLETPEAEADLARLAALAGETRACLLCFEADPATCHRRAIADILAGRYGFAVTDLAVAPPDPALSPSGSR